MGHPLASAEFFYVQGKSWSMDNREVMRTKQIIGTICKILNGGTSWQSFKFNLGKIKPYLDLLNWTDGGITDWTLSRASEGKFTDKFQFQSMLWQTELYSDHMNPSPLLHFVPG